MNTIQMAAKLYECRQAARSLLGAHYQRDMAMWATAIRGVAKDSQTSELAAANKMAREADGFGAIVIMAAFIEMTDPEPPNARAKGPP